MAHSYRPAPPGFRRCVRCSSAKTLDQYETKPNGEYYATCASCRARCAEQRERGRTSIATTPDLQAEHELYKKFLSLPLGGNR